MFTSCLKVYSKEIFYNFWSDPIIHILILIMIVIVAIVKCSKP